MNFPQFQIHLNLDGTKISPGLTIMKYGCLICLELKDGKTGLKL